GGKHTVTLSSRGGRICTGARIRADISNPAFFSLTLRIAVIAESVQVSREACSAVRHLRPSAYSAPSAPSGKNASVQNLSARDLHGWWHWWRPLCTAIHTA